MLHIVISDDNKDIVMEIKKVIENTIFIEEYEDIVIELATTSPKDVLKLFYGTKKLANGDVIRTPKPLKQRLLFLDINFGTDYPDLDGIKLGTEIRKVDIFSNIVYVTSNGEERADVLNEKIAALGYLKKRMMGEELNKRIVDLLTIARERMHMWTPNRQVVEIKTGHSKKYVNLADIYYIKGNEVKDKESEQASLGLTVLHTTDGVIYLKRKLKFYTEEIPQMVRLGRSYLVNPQNVVETRTSGKQGFLLLSNGEEISALKESLAAYEEGVSERYAKGIL